MIIEISERQKNFEYVKSILWSERERIHQMPGIVGSGISHSNVTGIGNGHHLVVYIDHEDQSIINQLPRTIYDIPVAYRVTGEIRALSSYNNKVFNSRYRPLQGGASVGIASIYSSTGTIAGFPRLTDGQFVILSNNHIIAGDNPGMRIAKIGNLIVQPGANDSTNLENNVVGTLTKWIPIIPKTISPFDINTVDCAYANIISPDYITINQTNLCGYSINYTIPPMVGMQIKKAGRTGCTVGTITELDTRVDVNYSFTSTPDYATFTGQIQTSPNFVQESDSGSAVVTSDTENAVGLVFATGTDGGATCNVMSDVETALGVSFGTGSVVPRQTQYPIQAIVMGGLIIGSLYSIVRYKKIKKNGK